MPRRTHERMHECTPGCRLHELQFRSSNGRACVRVDRPNLTGGWPPETGTEATQLVDERRSDHAYETNRSRVLASQPPVPMEFSRLRRYLLPPGCLLLPLWAPTSACAVLGC